MTRLAKWMGSPGRVVVPALALAAVLALGAGDAWAAKIDQAEDAAAMFDDATALRLFQEVLDESPNDPRLRAAAYLGRGEIHVSNRDTDLAIADFSAALALPQDPAQRAVALVARAEAYGRKGQAGLAQALADYNESLAIAPGQTGVLTARGGLRQRMGDKDGALVDYDAELKLRPRFYRALVGKAQILGTELPPNPEDGRRSPLNEPPPAAETGRR